MPDAICIVLVACAATHTIVRYELDRRAGTLGSMAVVARLPGVPPSHQSIPLAISTANRRLYAATRSPPYLLVEYELDCATLTLVGTTPLPFSTAFLVADRAGGCLLAASYPDSCLAVIRIAHEAPMISCVLPDIARAHSVTVVPTNDTVYAAELGRDRILAFDYDATVGTLSAEPVATARLRSGCGPRHLVLNADATRLYCLNETDATIDVLGLDPRERRMEHLQTTVLPGVDPRVRNQRGADVHLSPDGHRLYASERDRDTIATFVVSSDGTLLSRAIVKSEPGPRAFALDPSGRYMVVAGQVSGCVSVHRIEPGSGEPGAPLSWPANAGASWVEILQERDGRSASTSRVE
jgi:6-phosphogluconolactonase